MGRAETTLIQHILGSVRGGEGVGTGVFGLNPTNAHTAVLSRIGVFVRGSRHAGLGCALRSCCGTRAPSTPRGTRITRERMREEFGLDGGRAGPTPVPRRKGRNSDCCWRWRIDRICCCLTSRPRVWTPVARRDILAAVVRSVAEEKAGQCSFRRTCSTRWSAWPTMW